MPICPSCNIEVVGNFCTNCGQSISQAPPQYPGQYPQTDYANIAVTLLIVGAMVLCIGIIALAFVPDEIEVEDVRSSSSGASIGLEVSGYKIGVILIAIGVLIEGIATALATKEHLRRLR